MHKILKFVIWFFIVKKHLKFFIFIYFQKILFYLWWNVRRITSLTINMATLRYLIFIKYWRIVCWCILSYVHDCFIITVIVIIWYKCMHFYFYYLSICFYKFMNWLLLIVINWYKMSTLHPYYEQKLIGERK